MKSALVATLVAAALAPAVAAAATDYATVLSASPVLRAVDVPQRVCRDEERLVGARPSGAGAVIGAIAGGVLGHNIGGGFGRAAATGLGVVAGAAIGNSVEVHAANAYPPVAVPVQRCGVVGRYENRVVGYDVVYEYAGRRYTTRTAYDPGRRLAVDVRPLAGAAVPDAAWSPAPPRGEYSAVPPAPVPESYYDEPGPAYAPRGPAYSAPVPPVAPTAAVAPPVAYITAPGAYVSGGWVARGHRWY